MADRKLILTSFLLVSCVLLVVLVQFQTKFNLNIYSLNAAVDETRQQSWGLFQNFVNQNNKIYSGYQEFNQKYEIFHKNYIYIQSENAKGQLYRLALNKFSDLSPEEFRQAYLTSFHKKDSQKEPIEESIQNIPDQFDWSTKGAVGPVKNQGKCGSCWAFSAIAGIEGAYFIKNGKLLDFSEQQLLDCSKKYKNYGCNGGLLENSYEYFLDYQYELETDYPYEAMDWSSCWYLEQKGQGYLKNYENVKKNEVALKASVSQRPTPILVDASTWQFYDGGILGNCSINLDHAVLAVGYGTDKDQMYWKIKNSWGSDWGEQGYIRVLRTESETSQGQCGVAVDPVYPVL